MVELSPAGACSYRLRARTLSRSYVMKKGEWTPVTDAGDLEYLLNNPGVIMQERPELGLRYYRCMSDTVVETTDGKRLRFFAGDVVAAGGVLHRLLRLRSSFRPVRAAEILKHVPSCRVLVVRAGGLGDVFMTLPAINTLKSRFPGADVYYATAPSNMRVLAYKQEIAGVYDTISAYDAGPFDLVVDLGYWAETAPGRECTHRSDVFARAFGFERVDSYRFTYHVTDEDREWAKQLIGDGPPIICVQLAGSINRRTPPASWYGPLLAALKNNGYRIMILGRDREQAPSDVINLTGQPPLWQLCAAIEQCTGAILGDSGPLYVANALGVPCVGLFGPVDPCLRVRDMPNCRPVSGNRAARCDPCNDHQLRMCDGYPACLAMIDRDEVLTVLEEAISGCDMGT